MNATPATVYFADAAFSRIEHDRTLPIKFSRMLDTFDLTAKVKGRTVGIKMHYGGSVGYTTVPPVFVRTLVQKVKDAGAWSVYVMDNNPADGIARGYTREVLGCEVVSTFGASRKYLYREDINYLSYDYALFGGEAVDCDFFIDLSHVKAHGACGFGGALKNIAMGVVPGETRGKIHHLEGGLSYDQQKCTMCEKCFNECKNGAITANREQNKIEFFFHNCTFCQHCVLICPARAIQMENRTFHDFARGMALTTAAFLRRHKPEDMLFINVLTNITVFCDCWGFSTPSLVPDIGILASTDLVAVDIASLDLIKVENFQPLGLPQGRVLGEGSHLFEKIHGKDPYLMLHYLHEVYGGSKEYRLAEIS